ncbi:hypothetical protein CRUP_009127, partial [Coryphaenoides rupestris]
MWRLGLLVLVYTYLCALGDCLFVTDYFTRTPRKLNAFNSFASVELFHFHVPDDTVMAVGGPSYTVVPGSFAVTLTWTLPNRTTGAFNVTSPLPGDWFLAAHLPKDEGKISVKGLYEECQYLFQPQLIVQRLIGIAVLYPGYFIDQMIPIHNRSALYNALDCREWRPCELDAPLPAWEQWYYVLVERYLSNADVYFRIGVQVTVVRAQKTIRARAPPVHNSSALDCREWRPCELDAPLPAWEQWYYVLVERYLSNADVYFRIGVQVTVVRAQKT